MIKRKNIYRFSPAFIYIIEELSKDSPSCLFKTLYIYNYKNRTFSFYTYHYIKITPNIKIGESLPAYLNKEPITIPD